jgi:Na+/H+ antiporter NhaD/arsenite permease-like protein
VLPFSRHCFLLCRCLVSLLPCVVLVQIVILTLTPIIIECCRNLGLDPFPLLMGQFVAANTLSIALIIGNPTNLIIAGAQGITFAEYLKWMLLPAIVAAITCFAALYLYYRKSLSGDASSLSTPQQPSNPWAAVKDRQSAAFGLCVLVVVLVFLAVGPYLELSMATITATAGILMLVKDLVLDLKKCDGSIVNMMKAEWRGNPSPPTQPSTTAPSAPVLVDGRASPAPRIESSESQAAGASTSVATAVAPSTTAFTPVFMPAESFVKTPVSDEAPVLQQSPAPSASSLTAGTNESQLQLLVRGVMDRMPWKLLPFVVSMFTLVEALSASGWVTLLASSLASATAGSSTVAASIFMLVVSSLACNLLNNQPMSVLFSRAVLDPVFINSFAAAAGLAAAATEDKNTPYTQATLAAVRELPAFKACIYSLVAGSNLGANITLIGALAGIMWSSVAKAKGITITYLQFAKVGAVIMIPVVLATAVAIGLEM